MSTALIALAIAGLGSWLMRVSFLALGPDRALPVPVDRALAHARPAMLAALLASVVAARIDAAGTAAIAPHVLGLAAAALAMWRTRSMPFALLAGMAVFAATLRVGGE